MALISTENQPKLRQILAQLYPMEAKIRTLLNDLKLDQTEYEFYPSVADTWSALLQRWRAQRSLDTNLRKITQMNPENNFLLVALESQLLEQRDAPDQSVRGWQAPENISPTAEKLTGKRNTLLPVNYLYKAVRAARCVGRILLSGGQTGTGFLLQNDFLLTNHHVLPNAAECSKAILEMNYEKNIADVDEPILNFRFDTDQFITDQADDWSLAKLLGDPTKACGFVTFGSPVGYGDTVNIIQHPGGSQKQIAIHHNVVVFAGQGRVQYLTDTLNGSSGSPVFNDNWHVVALHHEGGYVPEPGGSRLYFRNEGIDIHTILPQIEKVIV